MADKVDVNAKWDACLDLSLRRFVYSSLAGAFGGFLLFRSPVTRWASVAFGAGVGIGSAYSECSHIFYGSPTKLESLETSNAHAHESARWYVMRRHLANVDVLGEGEPRVIVEYNIRITYGKGEEVSNKAIYIGWPGLNSYHYVDSVTN